MKRRDLRFYLDGLVATYDRRFLSSDPLAFVHRYPDPEDQEIVGMVSSALAYGNVPAIRRSVGDALNRLGSRPSRTLDTSLRAMDPADPVRYDFALCRLGILDACPRHRDATKCAACPLQPVCLL